MNVIPMPLMADVAQPFPLQFQKVISLGWVGPEFGPAWSANKWASDMSHHLSIVGGPNNGVGRGSRAFDNAGASHAGSSFFF